MMINAEWHKKNRMLKNPSEEERIKWHRKHLEFCNCRKPSDKMMTEIKEYELRHTGK